MYNLANIRRLAEAKKLKIKDVFEYAEITDMGLRKSIENQNMSLKTLDKLADLFEVSISELIADSRYNSPKEEIKKGGDIDVYRKLTSTQEELIRKQEKLYYNLEKQKQDLEKQVEKLKNEVELSRGYSLVATPPVELNKKK